MLWAYRANFKTATGFSSFQFVHEVEAVTPVECKIPSVKISINVLPGTTNIEEPLLHLENIDEKQKDVLTANETHKNRVKTSTIKP